MELSTHYIMAVASDNIDTGSTLIIPDSHSLIVTCWQNPWKLIMEISSSYVVDMTFQCEKTPFLFIIPNFYETIITAWYKQWKLRMEVNASYSSIMFLNLYKKILKTLPNLFLGYNPTTK